MWSIRKKDDASICLQDSWPEQLERWSWRRKGEGRTALEKIRNTVWVNLTCLSSGGFNLLL